MHLLVSTGNFSNHLTPNFYYLLNELDKLINLEICYESGDINEIIKACDIRPDFVFINEFEETNSPKITGLSSLKIPYGVLMHDLHYEIRRRRKLIRELKTKYIFSLYRDKFYEWYPEFWKQLYWLPHQVNTAVFRDYQLKKDINCLMMGAVHAYVYPLRYKIFKEMRDFAGFVYHEHPGYHNFSQQDKERLFIGENYAKEINRAKIFVTCNSRYCYPLAKYFEVLACNTLLLAPASKEIADLGLIAGVHFVNIDETDFKHKIDYYLTNEDERLKIARQGYELVHSRHSASQRASDLLNIINGILSAEVNPE